jgi:hypothetical protein
VFGALNSGDTELDATNGHVHLLLTTVKGVIVSADGNFSLPLTALLKN